MAYRGGTTGHRFFVACAVAVVAFTMFGGVAGAQDDGGGPSYLPDAQVKGIPASQYRVVIAGEDCKLDASDNPVLSGGTSLIPGVGGIVDAITPDISAPTALCPSALAKDGLGKATSGSWALGVTVISVVTGGMQWLLDFDVADLLSPVVSEASDRIDTRIVGRLNLAHFALAAAGIAIGWMFLTGRFVRAFGELARAVVALALAGLVMANVAGFYRTMSDFGREASSAGLSVAGEDNAKRPLDSIREALIWDQWQAQQFRDTLPPECADAAHAALRDDKSVIKAVDGAGCHNEAKRASKSSWGRLFAAMAYLLLAMFMAWQLAKLALGLLVGQVALALSFAFAPVACALAPLRGARSVFGVWLGAIARFLAGMVFAALLLSVTVLVMVPVLHAPWPPFFRLAAAAGTVWTMGRLSRSWLQGFERSAHRGMAAAAVGGVAVGAGMGAGAVAAQGIVSSSHQRADLLATQARQRSMRTVTRAGGKASDLGQKAVGASPPARNIQDRREARHKLDQKEHRQEVRRRMDELQEKREKRDDKRTGRFVGTPGTPPRRRPRHEAWVPTVETAPERTPTRVDMVGDTLGWMHPPQTEPKPREAPKSASSEIYS